MSGDMWERCPETSHGAPGRNRTFDTRFRRCFGSRRGFDAKRVASCPLRLVPCNPREWRTGTCAARVHPARRRSQGGDRTWHRESAFSEAVNPRLSNLVVEYPTGRAFPGNVSGQRMAEVLSTNAPSSRLTSTYRVRWLATRPAGRDARTPGARPPAPRRPSPSASCRPGKPCRRHSRARSSWPCHFGGPSGPIPGPPFRHRIAPHRSARGSGTLAISPPRPRL